MGENLQIVPQKNDCLATVSHPFGNGMPKSWEKFLEYAGAAMGIAGWFGVCQIGNTAAQQAGFFIWVAGALILVGWGYRTHARGIMLINIVNAFMAASAFAALIR